MQTFKTTMFAVAATLAIIAGVAFASPFHGLQVFEIGNTTDVVNTDEFKTTGVYGDGLNRVVHCWTPESESGMGKMWTAQFRVGRELKSAIPMQWDDMSEQCVSSAWPRDEFDGTEWTKWTLVREVED